MVASFPGLPSFCSSVWYTGMEAEEWWKTLFCFRVLYWMQTEQQNGGDLGTRLEKWYSEVWSLIVTPCIFPDKHMSTMAKFAGGFSDAPPAPWVFALAGREHSKRYVRRERRKMETITLMNPSLWTDMGLPKNSMLKWLRRTIVTRSTTPMHSSRLSTASMKSWHQKKSVILSLWDVCVCVCVLMCVCMCVCVCMKCQILILLELSYIAPSWSVCSSASPIITSPTPLYAIDIICTYILQKLQCSPTSDGAGAAVLANEVSCARLAYVIVWV